MRTTQRQAAVAALARVVSHLIEARVVKSAAALSRSARRSLVAWEAPCWRYVIIHWVVVGVGDRNGEAAVLERVRAAFGDG